MLIVAGLGNPGASHAANRHNIGAMAADAIARRHAFSPWRNKFKSLIAEGEIGGERILLIKPQTYMNLSGEAVGAAMRFHKLQPAGLIVLYDELDLLPGKVRVRTGGGSGGHNGIRSIDAHCGNDFHRLRLGIGHPGVKHLVQRHVLGDFAKADAVWLEPLLDALAEHFALLVKGENSSFMNKIALAVGEKPQKAENPPPKAKSHARQARNDMPAPKLPPSGPLAVLLKKLFGKD